MTPPGRLPDLGRRIERIAVAPETIRAPLVRLIRPVLTRIGWQPKVSVQAARALCDALRSARTPENRRRLDGLVDEAIDELESNVAGVERSTVVNRSVPMAHAAWLRRLYEVVSRASRAAENPGRRAAARIATGDDSALLPPLTVKAAPDDAPEAAGEPASAEGGADMPDPSRLLDLQLGAVDHLLAAAREESDVLARRRRLLEAARQLLLETSAALPLEPAGVEARLGSIARDITRLDRLQAAGVAPDVGLLHQARTAVTRGERERLFAVLTAVDRFAVARGDLDTVDRTEQALRKLDPDCETETAAAISASLDRSVQEVFGEAVAGAVTRGYERARENLADIENRFVQGLMAKYLAPGAERAMLSAALCVDGSFDVGGVLSPVRVTEQEIRLESVPFPTPEMILVPARGPEDVPNAVIEDPRLVLLSLAEGKLLTRRYVQERPHLRKRTVMRGEVRIYVLDGSGSMIGPRARMRDAILVAELATLARRLAEPRRKTRVVLFYRYFNEGLGPVTRVDSGEEAVESIVSVLATPRSGGTEIQAALLASLRQARDAKAEDPDLARAQIVLVTDGDGPVSDSVIAAAREEADFPVGISVIALGEENAALRQIVARQRARGERAFYHFIDDARLAAIAFGNIDGASAIHLPGVPVDPRAPPEVHARVLDAMMSGLLDELAALGRERDLAAMERLGEHSRRVRDEASETGSSVPAVPGEGERARVEAIRRDRRALDHRFERWFPPPQTPAASGPGTDPEEGTLERHDLESVVVLLATIAEVVRLVEGSELARKADAIDLLERLLADAKLSPARYEAVLSRYPAQLRNGLETIHRCVKWGIVESIRPAQRSR